MPAPHPRMHGLTHVPGGPDPVPGLIPTAPQGSYSLTVLAHPCLQHYWRGGPDDLKDGWNMTVHTADVAGVTYPHVGGTGPIAGDDGGAVTNAGLGGVVADDEGRLDYSGSGTGVPYLLYPHPWTVEVWALLTTTSDLTPGVFGQDLLLLGGVGGITLSVFTDNKIYLGYGGAQVSAGFPQGVWVHVVGRHTGSLLELILGGVVVDSVASSSAAPVDNVTWLNLPTGPNWEPWNGSSADLAIYDCALTDAELAGHRDLTDATGGSGGPGAVLTLDENGNPSWQPPGVEVTHGDGQPDEAPATKPPSLSGPTNGSGWHLDAHVETAVLYDSSPARFDVPSRTWVRVPFNTVRIQRRWETTVNGPVKEAWLPDDRDLTSQAANGLLHISAEMGSPQDVSGWFTIEYPILDFTALPDYSGEAGTDAYARAARIVNASTGLVLRETPGSSDRQFFEWLFREFAADGLVGIVQAAADNPYPVYAAWPDRPLLKPGPYPQIDPVSSRTYYMRDAFYGGFSHEYGLGVIDATLAAGANLCLQAWQDTPWTLRFSTDHFPNYTPMPYPELWKQRPYLAVSYSYDPDSVDHTTGRLL